MKYKLSYNPCVGVILPENLKGLVHYLFRIGGKQRYAGPLTRWNLYFLYYGGEQQLLANISRLRRREELANDFLSLVCRYPADRLCHDVITITPDFSSEDRLESFSDILFDVLPSLYGQDFLSSSLCLILHADERYYGHHIHRIYLSDRTLLPVCL